MKKNKLTDAQRLAVLERLDPFLRSISVPESQEGRYTEHRTLASGFDAGDRVVGFTGLKPTTIQEILDKNPKIRKKFKGQSGKDLAEKISQNPMLEPEIANAILQYKQKGHGKQDNPVIDYEQKLAYAWRWGRKAALDATPEELQQDKYSTIVNSNFRTKFPELLKKLSPADFKRIDEREIQRLKTEKSKQ